MSLDLVLRILDTAGVRYAVIGAVALAARGVSRSTADVDLLTTERQVLSEPFWNREGETAFRVDVRMGDWDDPLAGVVRIGGQEPIDVVVGKYRWQRDVVHRAERISVRGLTLPIPTASDLILLKLFAGGYRDLVDVRTLLSVGARQDLVAEVTAKLSELPREAADAWERIVTETA
jgi:hypothetical protein